MYQGGICTETLQRRLKHERKCRRRLQLQLQRCAGGNLSPPSGARSHYSYSSSSAGGSTDSDDAQPHLHRPQQQQQQQQSAQRASLTEHGAYCVAGIALSL